jgi:hypothetical protein
MGSARGDGLDFFKAGLLANAEEAAAELASRKIRSVRDLGYRDGPRRSGRVRPKYWSWGGADEVPIQEKPNVASLPDLQQPEPWTSLGDLYSVLDDDTAVADTIFVALAGGRAHIERDVAERVIRSWWGDDDDDNIQNGKGRKQPPQRQRRRQFDRDAFYRSVRRGQLEFVASWAAFLSVSGVAGLGIIFPTNPIQLALVDALEVVLGKR